MTITSSYIDPSSLVECLQLYYDGHLDNCEEYLDRLYMNTREMHPTNSLFGQITSKDMRYILSKLTKIQRASVRYILNRCQNAYSVLSEYYSQELIGEEGDLTKWVWKTYFDAKEIISQEILKII